MPIRVTEVLNYFQQPWYTDWALRTFAKQFKKHPDVEKAQKFAMRDLNKIKDDATEIGSRVDELIKANCGLTTVSMMKEKPEVSACINAFNKWHSIYQPNSITPCTRLNAVIEGQDVTGEPDLMVDDVLVDIKCAKRMSLSYWVQVNVYTYLQSLQVPTKFVSFRDCKVAILRLDKETASYEYVVQDYNPSLVDVWVGMMRAYLYFNKEKIDGDEL